MNALISNAEEDLAETDADKTILWGFSNVDMIEKRYWNRLESFFFDTYKSLPD